MQIFGVFSFVLSTIRFDKESFQHIFEYILKYSSAVTSVEEFTTGTGTEATITTGTIFEIGAQSGSIINMLIFFVFLSVHVPVFGMSLSLSLSASYNTRRNSRSDNSRHNRSIFNICEHI